MKLNSFLSLMINFNVIYLIFIHMCSLRTVHQNNVFQVYIVHFYYQILILIYVFCKCIWSFVTHIFHNSQPSHGGDRIACLIRDEIFDIFYDSQMCIARHSNCHFGIFKTSPVLSSFMAYHRVCI
jgi:hypothetical protein